MKSVALKLHLSEDSDEDTILSEVVKLAEHDAVETKRADVAEATLAEEAKRIRREQVERTLGELIDGGHLLPGQKDKMLALAEDSAAGFDRTAEILRTTKAIVLGELGTSDPGGDGSDDPTVELAEKSEARAKSAGISYAEAMAIVLSEDPALKTRYDNRNL